MSRTLIRPDAHKKQFSLKQICLVTTAIAVIMVIEMPMFARVCFAIYVVLFGLFADWRHDLLDRASRSIDLGRFEKAHSQIEEHIARCPDDSSGYFWRGYAFVQQNEMAFALADFETAIEMNSKDGHFWIWKGLVQMDGGNYADAIDSFNAAQIRLPGDPGPWLHVGLARMQAGQIEIAEQEVSELIEAHPGDAAIEHFYTTVLFLQGRYQELLTFLADVGQHPVLDDYRILSEFKSGNHTTAFADVLEYCADPESSDKCGIYSWMLATCPNPEFRNAQLAVQHAKRAMEIQDVWQYQSYLAAAHAENSQFDLAVEFGRKSLEGCWPVYRKALQARLELYRSGKPYRDTGQPVHESS